MVNEVRVNNLEWREFLKAFRELNSDNTLSNIIESEFLNAEYLIDCMSNSWDLQTQIPRINVDSFLGSKNNSSKLYYDPKDMTININSDLISVYFKGKNQIELEKSRNEFLWGIAHEFFHHGRNHIAIWNHFGIKENDASSKNRQILLCLEDDADTLATTALYRHFLNNVHKGSDSYSVKLKVLAALFRTIRSKIQETKNQVLTKHPAWSTRLCSQIIKLSELDNVENDPQSPEERVTKYTIYQQELLTYELIKMEKDYCHELDFIHYILKPVILSKEDKLLNEVASCNPDSPVTQRFLDLYHLNETTILIEGFLRANCNLPGLNSIVTCRMWQPKKVRRAD